MEVQSKRGRYAGDEEWTETTVIAIRRLAREGKLASEIKEELNLPQKEDTIRRRARRYSITLSTGSGRAGARTKDRVVGRGP